MRFALIVLVALGSQARADTVDMGTWDCTHNGKKTVSVSKGEHTYVWHGSCSGAEGFSVEMKPAMKDWKTKETKDPATNEIKLWVKNPGIGREVTFSIFVGFA